MAQPDQAARIRFRLAAALTVVLVVLGFALSRRGSVQGPREVVRSADVVEIEGSPHPGEAHAARQRLVDNLVLEAMPSDEAFAGISALVDAVCDEARGFREEGGDLDTALERAFASTAALRRALLDRGKDETGRPRRLLPDVGERLRARYAEPAACSAMVELWVASRWPSISSGDRSVALLTNPPEGSRQVAYFALEAAGASGNPSLVTPIMRSLEDVRDSRTTWRSLRAVAQLSDDGAPAIDFIRALERPFDDELISGVVSLAAALPSSARAPVASEMLLSEDPGRVRAGLRMAAQDAVARDVAPDVLAAARALRDVDATDAGYVVAALDRGLPDAEVTLRQLATARDVDPHVRLAALGSLDAQTVREVLPALPLDRLDAPALLGAALSLVHRQAPGEARTLLAGLVRGHRETRAPRRPGLCGERPAGDSDGWLDACLRRLLGT